MTDIDGFPTDFCPICGGLIDLDTLDDYITCHVCRNRLPFEEFIGTTISTHMKLK
jgi:hypothetical protein